MTNFLRNIIQDAIDTAELESKLYDAVVNRIDYEDIAERIIETVDSEEIAEVALDFFLNG